MTTYIETFKEIRVPVYVANECARCGRPWEDHYKLDMLKYKRGPWGSFGLIADHMPHIRGIHA